MNPKDILTRLPYKIEAKPEGGFIARATDPTVPPLEAATREDLQKQIGENMLKQVSAATSGLAKLPADGRLCQLSFQIVHKPGGGFSIHSGDPNTPVMEVADMKEFEAQFLDKYVNLIGGSNFLIPTLAKAFAAQAGAGTMEIRANSTLTHKISGAKALAFGVPGSSDASNTATNLSGSIANNPITPESTSGWKIFCFILLAIVAGLVYAFFHYR